MNRKETEALRCELLQKVYLCSNTNNEDVRN